MVASRQERVLPNFRQGDAVVLYERNTDTDNVTNKMVFKGNIERISDNEVCIRLRATQQNAGVLPAASLYAIEHDYMDTSFLSMYLGLSAFLSATQRRRDLLLVQRPPGKRLLPCPAARERSCRYPADRLKGNSRGQPALLE